MDDINTIIGWLCVAVYGRAAADMTPELWSDLLDRLRRIGAAR